MECAKQGLTHFVPEIYTVDRDVSHDYFSLPRPCHNLALILAGVCNVVEDGGEPFSVTAGEVLFVPKKCRYRLEWTKETRVHTIHFDLSDDPFAHKRVPLQKLTVDDFAALEQAYGILDKNENSFRFCSVFYGVLDECFRHVVCEDAPRLSVQPALDYLESHVSGNVTVRTLAQTCCMSESYFFARFRKETGTTPVEYKNRLCVSRAMRALVAEPDKSMEEIARETGFASDVYFRRVFKAVTGRTPREWRKTGWIL